MEQVRILVVDDSAFMRKMISSMIERDPNLKVVGTARDGRDAIEKVKELQPDVMTLDIEMPAMDGLSALEIIMEQYPLPVIMVSSHTTEGAEMTLRALDLGAVDFIAKQTSFVNTDIVKIEQELIRKIKAVSGRKSFVANYRPALQSSQIAKKREMMQRGRSGVAGHDAVPEPQPVRQYAPVAPAARGAAAVRVIAVGTSTGGPPALQALLTKIPASLSVPMLIVQHMPPAFTGPLAKRLNSLCQIEVREAIHGERLTPGVAFLAPGGKHMTVRNGGIVLSDEPVDSLHRPSVDVMVASAIREYGKSVLGVIMTGMGSDGAKAMKVLHDQGGTVLAQSAESCVVYGMPRAVVEANAASEVAELGQLADRVMAYV